MREFKLASCKGVVGGAFYTMVAGKKSESVLIVCSVRITVTPMMIIGQKALGVWGFLEAI